MDASHSADHQAMNAKTTEFLHAKESLVNYVLYLHSICKKRSFNYMNETMNDFRVLVEIFGSEFFSDANTDNIKVTTGDIYLNEEVLMKKVKYTFELLIRAHKYWLQCLQQSTATDPNIYSGMDKYIKDISDLFIVDV